METSLILLQDPVKCPVCFEAGRVGFLFIQPVDAQVIGLNGSKSQLSCNTCGALFAVKDNDGKTI
jgi:hypothetical protein